MRRPDGDPAPGNVLRIRIPPAERRRLLEADNPPPSRAEWAADRARRFGVSPQTIYRDLRDIKTGVVEPPPDEIAPRSYGGGWRPGEAGPAKGQKGIQLMVYVRPEQHRFLHALARREGRSVSAVVRDAIAAEAESHDWPFDEPPPKATRYQRLAALRKQARVDIEEHAQRFGVSIATARSDLKAVQLERTPAGS